MLSKKETISVKKSLPQVVRQLNACLTLNELLETARKESLKLTQADDSLIILLNSTTRDVYIRSTVRDDSLIASFFDIDNGLIPPLVEHIFSADDVFYCPDTSQDSNLSLNFDGGNGTLLCIPVTSETRIIGFICVEKQETYFFDDQKITQLSILADHLSIAIENQILKDIGIELSTLNLDDMLTKIAEYAYFLLGSESSAILLTETRVGSRIKGKKFPSYRKGNFTPRPDGLTQTVANENSALIISDTHLDPRVKQTTKDRGIKSIIGVPLKISSTVEKDVRVMGALFVNSVKNNDFNSRDQKLLESLASQAAIALEKAQLVESEQRRAKAFEDLFHRSLELISYEDSERLLNQILDNAVNTLDVQGGCVYLLDKEGKNLKLLAKKNRLDLTIGGKRAVEDDLVGRVIAEVKAITISNYNEWPNRPIQNSDQSFSSVAAAPIGWQGEVKGVLAVHDNVPGSQFGSEELDLLWYLGNLAAVALGNIYRIGEKKRLMEDAFDAIIALDKNGQIVQFNTQAERILGYKAEEVINKIPIRKLYTHLSDAQEVMRHLRRPDNGHRISNFNTSLTNKYEQEIPIRLSASMLFDHDGQFAGSVGFFQDRREYKASLELIKSSLDLKETLDSLAEQAWQFTNASQSCHISLRAGRNLELTAAYPVRYEAQLKRTIGRIDLESDNKIGISGRAVVDGKSIIEGQVVSHADYILSDSATHSELAVPIINQQNEVIGVIDIEHRDYDAFTPEDQQTLELLAKVAAVAIRNAQLYEKSEADKKRFKTIAKVSRSSTHNLKIPQLLKQVCQLLEQDLKKKEAIVSIRLFNPERGLLEFPPDWHESFHKKIDIPAEKGRTTQRLDEGICGWVASHKTSKSCGDVEKCKDFLRLMSGTQSELTVPICHWKEETLIGVLDLQSSLKNAFDDDDQKLLEALADQLAVAIENAKLYEKEAQRSGMRKALYQAGRAITASLKLTDILGQIVQQTPKVIRKQGRGVSFASIRLIQDGRSQLIAAYPTEKLDRIKDDCLVDQDYPNKNNLLRGVIGRAYRTGDPQLVPDVSIDPDYVCCVPETKSELTVPIKIDNKVIGIINIEHIDKNAFNKDDQIAVVALATQAGIAIDKAKQYDNLNRWSQHQQAVHEASRIISAGITVTRKDLLDRILQQAIERIKPAKGTHSILGVIQLYDKATNELIPESVLPEKMGHWWETQLGKRRLLDRNQNKIGIQGRAILERKPQRVPDVRLDEDYMKLSDQTRSELDVPLLDGDEALGVLGLESDQIGAFDEIDEQALTLLAELAVIAIKNAEQYHPKNLLAARTAIAWMAADRTAWQHKIVGYISAIEKHTQLISHDLNISAPPMTIRGRLVDIERVIEKTREKKISTPLAPDQGLEVINFNQFIEELISQFYWDEERRRVFPYELDLDPKCIASINVNPAWLKLAIDNVMSNAINAMDSVQIKKLTVASELVENQVRLTVSDTGKGIAPDIENQLFSGIVDKSNRTSGQGIGLSLTQIILQTYNGDCYIKSNSPDGTSVVVWLPIHETER